MRDERLEPLSHYSYYKKIRKDSNHRSIPTPEEAPKEILQAVVDLLFYKKTHERALEYGIIVE